MFTPNASKQSAVPERDDAALLPCFATFAPPAAATIAEVVEILKQRDPLSLKIVTLLDKPDRRVVGIKADYSLFTIPDYFVIGYGLDYGEYYRNLPYIAEYNVEG